MHTTSLISTPASSSRSRFVAIVAVAFIMSACAGSSGNNAASGSKNPIPIGIVYAVTGAYAGTGVGAHIGAIAAVDTINAAGGINGRPLKPIFCDDESNVAKDVTCVNQFVDQGAVAVVGPLTSPQALAVAPVATKAHIPLMAAGVAAALTDPLDPWVFRSTVASNTILLPWQPYLATQSWKKFALINDTSAYGSDQTKSQKAILKTLGFEVVADQSYGPADTDMSAQMARIRDAHPDAILNAGTPATAAVIARNRAALGMTDIPLIEGAGAQSDAFISLAANYLQGTVVFIGWKIAVFDSLPKSDKLYGSIAQFIQAWPKDASVRPDGGAGLGWDAVHMVALAMKSAANPADSAQVRDAIEALGSYIGASAVWDYTATSHDGLTADGLVMSKLVGGKWVALSAS
jgi:branched-chain amino acid transport system substrate-binding protein